MAIRAAATVLMSFLLVIAMLLAATPASPPAASPTPRIHTGIRDISNTNVFLFARETNELQSSDWPTFVLVEWTAGTPRDTLEVRMIGPEKSIPYNSQSTAGTVGPRRDWFFFPVLGTPVENEVGDWSGQVLVNGAPAAAGIRFKVLPGDYPRALAEAQALAARYPRLVDPVYMLGALQADLGKSREARQLLDNAIRMAPAYLWPHIALARLMRQGGDLVSAANEIARARRFNQSPRTSLTPYVSALLDAMSRLP